MTRIRLLISVMAALVCCVAGYAAQSGNATDQASSGTHTVPSASYFFPGDQPSYRLGSIAEAPSLDRVVATSAEKSVRASGATLCGITNVGGSWCVSSTTVAENAAIATEKTLEGGMWTYSGAVYVNGRYYVLSEAMGVVYRCDIYDASSGWMMTSGPGMSGSVYPVSMAYNPVDDKVYGSFNGNSAGTVYEFGTFDITTARKTVIASLPQRFAAVAADNSGTVYGIAADGALYTIDTTSGALAKVGDTGVTVGNGKQDACFDHETGEMFWIVSNAIYAVDTQSGRADKISDISGGSTPWIGLFVRPDNSKVIPSWVDDMVLDYDKDVLSGYVRFKMPSLATSGAVIEGPMQYQITIDDDQVTGSAAAGEQVDYPYTMTEGEHTVKVLAIKDGITGMESSQKRFFGHDIPRTPGGLTVAENGSDNVSIRWNAVTSGVNSGYVDVDAMRYTVTRKPDNVVIAENIASTEVVDRSINAMNYYTYEVVAGDGVKSSAVAVSERLLLGEEFGVCPPYRYEFGEEGFGVFTEVDANADGYKWVYSDDPAMVWYVVNPSKDSDDWLISPPIRLTKGHHYNLKIKLTGSSRYETERVELFYGKAPNPESMTSRIAPAKDFVVSGNLDEWLVAEDDGLYYIGLHVITEAVEGAMRIDLFDLGGGFDGRSPAAAEAEAIPGPKGAMSATVSFACPVKTFNGGNLSNITKVVVTNTTTGRVIYESENPAVGAPVSASDANPVEGTNEYTVVCSNEYGEGDVAKISCWVGVDLPGLPRNVKWVQLDDDKVRLTWDAPEGGEHGGYVDVANLKYCIVMPETNQIVHESWEYLYMELQPGFEQDQELLSFGVCGVNEKGLGVAVRSNQSAFGKAYKAPFYESFEGANIHSNPWRIMQLSGYNPYAVLTDLMGLPIKSYDDNGMVVYTPLVAGSTRLELPMVDISALDKPVFKMWCYMFDTNTVLNIRYNNNAGLDWHDICTVEKNDRTGWSLVTVDLSAVKGESRLQLGIEAVSQAMGMYVLLDKMSIVDNLDCDPMLSAWELPDKASAGSTFDLSVSVTNNGALPVEDYSVDIIVNGDLAASKPGVRLDPDGVAVLDISVPLSPNATSMELLAMVNCEKDGDLSNNEKQSSSIKVIRSRFPQPSGLVNQSADPKRVELAWSKPATGYKATVLDDLETYEPGSIGGIDISLNPQTNKIDVKQTVGAIGDYKLIDNDKLLTEYVMGVVGHGVPNLGKGMVCQVFDVDEYELHQSSLWAAHSGSRFFVFWTTIDASGNADIPNDDYLILPKLAEDDPHISFWAKSLTDKYGLESFAIMVSMDGNELEDFVQYVMIGNIPAGYATDPDAGYTFFEFDLPEGTKYAAIRYNATGTTALLVDDISYTPDNNYQDLTLNGYNVYRNNQRLNTEPVTDTNFADVPVAAGDYRYNVTSVFAEGESRFSNTVTVNGFSSGIEDAAVGGDSGSIYVEGREIVIEGMNGADIMIYTPDGRMVERLKADELTRVKVAGGVYVVRVADKAVAVAVK